MWNAKGKVVSLIGEALDLAKEHGVDMKKVFQESFEELLEDLQEVVQSPEIERVLDEVTDVVVQQLKLDREVCREVLNHLLFGESNSEALSDVTNQIKQCLILVKVLYSRLSVRDINATTEIWVNPSKPTKKTYTVVVSRTDLTADVRNTFTKTQQSEVVAKIYPVEE